MALSRALIEAAQSRLTLISGARDDLPALAGAAAHQVFDTFTEPVGERAFAARTWPAPV